MELTLDDSGFRAAATPTKPTPISLEPQPNSYHSRAREERGGATASYPEEQRDPGTLAAPVTVLERTTARMFCAASTDLDASFPTRRSATQLGAYNALVYAGTRRAVTSRAALPQAYAATYVSSCETCAVARSTRVDKGCAHMCKRCALAALLAVRQNIAAHLANSICVTAELLRKLRPEGGLALRR